MSLADSSMRDLAKLSRLDLPDEIDALCKDFDALLTHLDVLARLDLSSHTPFESSSAHAPDEHIRRSDVLSPTQLAKLAPSSQREGADTFITLPSKTS